MTIEKRETAHQNIGKNTREYKKKRREKAATLLKKKTITQNQHEKLTQNFEI
jgi:hypothetical protein